MREIFVQSDYEKRPTWIFNVWYHTLTLHDNLFSKSICVHKNILNTREIQVQVNFENVLHEASIYGIIF